MSIESLLSKLFGVDVAVMNDGHGLGCPCPKHRAEAKEREARVARDGFPAGSIGAALDDELSAAIGRDVLADRDVGDELFALHARRAELAEEPTEIEATPLPREAPQWP